jgi:hypothetical protein
MRPIKTGPPADETIIVADGIGVSERVVTEGYYRLQPGVAVAIRPPKDRAAEIVAAQGRAP